MTIASLLLALSGLALLALAMNRHRDQMLGKGAAVSMEALALARPVGGLLLALALAACVAAHGWSMGMLWWLGVLTAGTAPVALLLTYRARMLPALMIAGPLAALIATLLL